MYNDQTYEVILQRMLDSIPDTFDKRQGSILYDLLAPAALELSFSYLSLSRVLDFGVANIDMPSEYLDLRVGELGLTRKPSVQAEGEVSLEGTANGVIAAGTRFSTSDLDQPLYFQTTADVTLGADGKGKAPAICEYGGVIGNIAAGQITYVVGNLSGVMRVTNEAAFAGGFDEESDVDLLGRYYERVRKPATGGNVYQYEQWAKSVSGVGDAKAYDADHPFGLGPGKVKIVIIDSLKRSQPPVIDELASDVYAFIEGERPVGVELHVQGAVELPINVSAQLTLQSGYTLATVQGSITSAIETYLSGLAFKDPIVRFSRIANLLLDVEGILDYTNLTINGGASNIQVAEGSLAVIGTVSMT